MGLLENLQNKPYESRVKILWATVFAAAVVMAVLFIFNLRNTIGKVGGSNLLNLNPPQKSNAQTAANFATVERVETSGRFLNIYFNFNNPTSDILNVSQLPDIALIANDQLQNPSNITDRQDHPFPQKILSHTQQFAILTFNATDAKQATLTFSSMFMDQNPTVLLQQKLDLNLKELSKPEKVRN